MVADRFQGNSTSAIPEAAVTKGKRRNTDACPALSPRAEAAIMRLAQLLGRQIARELHEERCAQERQVSYDPPEVP